MSVNAKIIAHSCAPGAPDLITMQVRFPWWLLPEMNTHRVFSRNYGSTRAIPISKLIDEANNDPALPIKWTSHRPGMQGGDDISSEQIEWAEEAYLEARDHAVKGARVLLDLGIAKQNANRLLMPFIHVEGIITATDWDNFFDLRCHPDADPTMRALAEAMRDAIKASVPADPMIFKRITGPHAESKSEDSWHLPYVGVDDWRYAVDLLPPGGGYVFRILAMISAARCARVSYLRHDGSNPDIEKDLALAKRLLESKHMSPFEHQALAWDKTVLTIKHWGNFRLWNQHRKMIEALS